MMSMKPQTSSHAVWVLYYDLYVDRTPAITSFDTKREPILCSIILNAV
jgi:hypothetical protein